MKRKKPCPHLEKLLPRISEHSLGRRQIKYVPELSRHASDKKFPYHQSYSKEQIDAFVQRVTKLGLKNYQVDLLVDRLLLQKPWKDIVEERGYINRQTAYKIFQDTFEYLKGLGLERIKKAN